MKNILIVINSMKIGGAEKSLLSFCQSFAGAEKAGDYSVDLMVICPEGPFMSQLPDAVNIIPAPTELRYLGSRFSPALYLSEFSWRPFLREIEWSVRKRLKLFPKQLNIPQRMWECWKDCIPMLEKKYDTAISYIDGVPNYYVMDKVCADKKTLWVHNEYQKQEYDTAYDRPYYEKCDAVITISDRCRDCILKEFPDMGEKVHVLENISSGTYIVEKSEADIKTEFEDFGGSRLLSVGRLNYLKGFDIAIEAAKLIHESGTDFLWLIVGDGPERYSLQEMIDKYCLNDCVRLLGARDNPYVYMRDCDMLIQPSRTEGKSIVLDEAKILCKPILVTNYTTVGDSIEHGETGWIVDISARGIAEGVLLLWGDRKLRNRLCSNLRAMPGGNEAQLEKYLQIML